jgi:hypothetical protein
LLQEVLLANNNMDANNRGIYIGKDEDNQSIFKLVFFIYFSCDQNKYLKEIENFNHAEKIYLESQNLCIFL